MALESGRAIHFEESKVRPMGRNATGVRGVTLGHAKDSVVGMITVEDDTDTSVMVVSEKGYGKRTSTEAYRITNRGGKGVKTMNITDKTGKLIAMKAVTDLDDLMIINKSGITIRLNVSSISQLGRATQGVRLIKLKDSDEIAAVAKVEITEGMIDDEFEDADLVEGAEGLEGDEGDVSSNDSENGPDVASDPDE